MKKELSRERLSHVKKVMKISITFFIVLFVSIHLNGQNSTIEVKEQEESIPTMKYQKFLFVVPYTPKLYNSEVDKKIVEINKKTIDEIRDEIRQGLATEICLRIKEDKGNLEPLNPYIYFLDSIDFHLLPIYGNVSYFWDNLVLLDSAENEGSKSKVQSFLNKYSNNARKKQDEPVSEKSTIQGGQITSYAVYGNKFMNVKVDDVQALGNYSSSNNVLNWLFLNQLDLTYVPQRDPYGGQMYNVRLHYTLLDKELNQRKSGVLTKQIPESHLALKSLKQEVFTEMASELAKQLNF